jgi:hypothetical protein
VRRQECIADGFRYVDRFLEKRVSVKIFFHKDMLHF